MIFQAQYRDLAESSYSEKEEVVLMVSFIRTLIPIMRVRLCGLINADSPHYNTITYIHVNLGGGETQTFRHKLGIEKYLKMSFM